MAAAIAILRFFFIVIAMTLGVLVPRGMSDTDADAALRAVEPAREFAVQDACFALEHQQLCGLSAEDFKLRLVPNFFTQGDAAIAAPPHHAPHFGLRPDKTWRDVERVLTDPAGPKTKLVIFLRHGQAQHNADKLLVGDKDWHEYYKYLDHYIDAPLTAKGMAHAQQAGEVLRQELNTHGLNLDLVVVSPLDRTLQTYEGVFSKIDQPIPVVSLEIARETLGVCPCDRRKVMAPKRAKYPHIDFSSITQDQDTWWLRDHRETDREIEARARKFLHHIFFERPEQRILVVSHSGFSRGTLRALGHPFFHPENGEFVPVLLEQVADPPTPPLAQN